MLECWPAATYREISANNATRENCPFCVEEYTENEFKNPLLVVELNCGHFFHFKCLGEIENRAMSLNFTGIRIDEILEEEKEPTSLQGRIEVLKDIGLACIYCEQLYASGFFFTRVPLGDKEEFLRRLKQIGEEYEYDPTVLAAIPTVETLFPSLLAMGQKDIKNNFDSWIVSVFSLIEANHEIKDKEIVKSIMTLVMCPNGALRNLEKEARRWKNIPFEEYPKRFREQGVKVYIANRVCFIRVSAAYIHRAARFIYTEMS